VLLYHESDKHKPLKQYEASYPPITEIRQVYRALERFQLAYGSGMGQSFDFDYAASPKVKCNLGESSVA